MATVYKRGKIWWGRAQRDNQELRKSLETGDRPTAQKRLRVWLDELDATNWGGRARVSYSEAARAFIVEYLPTLKPASAKRYGVSLKWLTDHFGDLTMDAIGREELSRFETQRRGLGTSNPTIRRDLACLSSIFAFCEDKEWIDDGKNPVPGFLKRRAKRGLNEAPGRKRYLKPAEEALLLEHASPDVGEAITIAIDTGLRVEEMYSLTWPQIDFPRGTIQTTTDTKNGKSRTVPLPQRSAQILAQRKQAGIKSFHVFERADGSRVFRNTKGFYGAVARAAKADGMAEVAIGFDPDLRWHDLRRTAGCRWLQSKKRSMEEVSRLLGHSSVLVTEKSYAFLNEEDVAQDVARTETGTRNSGQRKKRKAE